MPWFIDKRDDKFCVVKGTKEEPGEQLKCYMAEAEANDYLKALYVNAGAEAQRMIGPSADDGIFIENKADIGGVSGAGMIHGEDGMLARGALETATKPAVDVTEDYIHIRVRDPGEFQEEPWGTIDIGGKDSGIKARVGRLKGEKTTTIQVYLFDKSKWTVERAKAWVEEHKEKMAPEIAEAIKVWEGEQSRSTKAQFTVYKSASGAWRWASVSSMAVQDKEFETVTEKAYDDAIKHANDTGLFGELDLVHIDGTDVGDCDLMIRASNRLIEGGTWRNTPRAQRAIAAVNARPGYWGTSIKFEYDESKFKEGKYLGNIRVLKRSVLPAKMAASYGTRFVAIGGEPMSKELREETKEALAQLGISDEEIASLTEKQVEQPSNVKMKEGPPVQAPPVYTGVAPVEAKEARPSVWTRLRELLSLEPKETKAGVEVASAEKKTEVTLQPAVGQTDMAEVIKSIAAVVGEQVGATMAQVKAQMDAQETVIQALSGRLAEAEKAVEDKVISRLADLPPVVKVATSQVAASVVPEQPKATAPSNQADYVKDLTAGVMKAVQSVLEGSKYTV